MRLLPLLLPLLLGGCLSFSSSNPPPPSHTTVVVPPGTTVVCPEWLAAALLIISAARLHRRDPRHLFHDLTGEQHVRVDRQAAVAQHQRGPGVAGVERVVGFPRGIEHAAEIGTVGKPHRRTVRLPFPARRQSRMAIRSTPLRGRCSVTTVWSANASVGGARSAVSRIALSLGNSAASISPEPASCAM